MNLIGKTSYILSEQLLYHSVIDHSVRALQCPSWGYPTEGAYYRDAASIDSMLAIRIPFFTVQAEDDPVGPAINSKV